MLSGRHGMLIIIQNGNRYVNILKFRVRKGNISQNLDLILDDELFLLNKELILCRHRILGFGSAESDSIIASKAQNE